MYLIGLEIWRRFWEKSYTNFFRVEGLLVIDSKNVFLLEKLIDVYLHKKFPLSHGTRKLITVLKNLSLDPTVNHRNPPYIPNPYSFRIYFNYTFVVINIGTMKSRRNRWAGSATRMGEILVGNRYLKDLDVGGRTVLNWCHWSRAGAWSRYSWLG
jgi:hypothetical protein